MCSYFITTYVVNEFILATAYVIRTSDNVYLNQKARGAHTILIYCILLYTI